MGRWMQRIGMLVVLLGTPAAVMAQSASGGLATGSNRAHDSVLGLHADPRALAVSPSLAR